MPTSRISPFSQPASYPLLYSSLHLQYSSHYYLPFMARTKSTKPFYADRGRWPLAEALFAKFKYQVRCPDCRRDPQNKSFVKDQAGTSPAEGPRRQWGCQRTKISSRTTEITCSRKSNTDLNSNGKRGTRRKNV